MKRSPSIFLRSCNYLVGTTKNTALVPWFPTECPSLVFSWFSTAVDMRGGSARPLLSGHAHPPWFYDVLKGMQITGAIRSPHCSGQEGVNDPQRANWSLPWVWNMDIRIRKSLFTRVASRGEGKKIFFLYSS